MCEVVCTGDRLAERLGDFPRQRVCALHTDLLAENRSRCKFKAVPASARTSRTFRQRCSRSPRRFCSRCRATCRNSPPRCWSASPTRRPSSAPLTTSRCASVAAMRARDGTARQGVRSPTRSRAPRCSARCSTSSVWTNSNCSSPAARRCRPRRWRCGRSGASTRSRSTARRKPRAASSPVSAGRFRARAGSARRPPAGR